MIEAYRKVDEVSIKSEILGGVITPMLGSDRHRQILAWWMGRGAGFKRSWSMVALVLGVMLTYATM